jgi:hypothetical protein
LRLVLLLILLLSLFGGCKEEKEVYPLSEDKKEILSFFPEDVQQIMFASFKGNSEEENIRQDTEKNDNNWLRFLEKEEGVTFGNGISGLYSGDTWEGLNVFVFRLDRSRKNVERFLGGNRFRKGESKGKEYYQLQGEETYFYLLNDSSLVVVNSLQFLLDRFEGRGKSMINNREYMNLIEGIRFKDNYWLATREKTFAAALLNQLIDNKDFIGKDLINNINGLSFSLKLEEGMEMESKMYCKSSNDAYLISNGIRTAIAMDLIGGDKEMQAILDKFEIEREGNIISIYINLNEVELEKFREKFGTTLKKNRVL